MERRQQNKGRTRIKVDDNGVERIGREKKDEASECRRRRRRRHQNKGGGGLGSTVRTPGS